MGHKNRKSDQGQTGGPALLEWIAGAAGAIISAGIIGVLATQALTSRAETPPDMRAEASTLHETADGDFILEVRVVNRSQQTGGAVTVAGELIDSDRTVEAASATLSYVPGHSHAEAGLIFTRDPRRYRLRLRILGYERP